MVYNSKHICTYQYYDSKFKDTIPSNFNIDDVDECPDSADLIYKSDLLQAFNLDEYDDAKIEEEMKHIFDKLKNNQKIVPCIKKMAERFLTNDIEFGLVLLFSYDNFCVTHLCIRDIIEKGDISEDNINLLVKLIN